MTRSAGMLWKTPWRRRTGGFVSQPPVNMWFFDLGGNTGQSSDYWFFESPLVSPSFADGPGPFWFGVVCKAGPPPAGQFFTESIFLNQFAGDGILAGASGSYSSPQDTESASVFISAAGITFGPIFPDDILQYDFNTAIVFFVRITPGLTDTLIQLCVDNQFFRSETSPNPYSPPTSTLKIYGNTTLDSGPSIHGIVGGTGAITDDQVAQWFEAVKVNGYIGGIAGQTTDLWSAFDVSGSAPFVPNPLPNAAGGQNLIVQSLGTPIIPPSNVLIPVSFNY